MFSTRLRSLCRRSPTRQFHASTHHFSSKTPESVKRSQANSVRAHPIDKFHTSTSSSSRSAKSGNKRTPGYLNWTPKDLDLYNISLNQVKPLEFFALPVSQDKFILQKTITVFHVTGIATTLG